MPNKRDGEPHEAIGSSSRRVSKFSASLNYYASQSKEEEAQEWRSPGVLKFLKWGHLPHPSQRQTNDEKTSSSHYQIHCRTMKNKADLWIPICPNPHRKWRMRKRSIDRASSYFFNSHFMNNVAFTLVL